MLPTQKKRHRKTAIISSTAIVYTKYRMLDNIQTIERQILSAITSVEFVSVKSKDGDLNNVSLSIQINEKSSVNTNREIERAKRATIFTERNNNERRNAIRIGIVCLFHIHTQR